MVEPPYGDLIFREAQAVMAGLTADLLCQLDPADPLLRDDLEAQQAVSIAAYVLLKSVILDFCGELPAPYLADLGVRVARRVEGLSL